MATTVAQPGTALRKIARTYAKQAGLSVNDYLSRLRRLNPNYERKQGSGNLRLGRGVRSTESQANQGFDSDSFLDEFFGGGSGGGGGGSRSEEQEALDILDSPLYTQTLKDYYLADYLPALTQSTFDINQARTQQVGNEADRARQRGEAVKRVAGSYAARGMRSPGAINRDRSEIQSDFARMSRAEQEGIDRMQNQRDVMFGTGATDSETFLSDPVKFGSIGAGARRDALSRLQGLPASYGLLGVNRASTAPGRF